MMIPCVGTFVHFVLPPDTPRAGGCRPACVTRVVTPDGTVNLTVFPDGMDNDGPVGGWWPAVPYDATYAPGTWHPIQAGADDRYPVAP